MAELFSAGPLSQLREEAANRRDTTARIRALLPAEEAAHLVSASIGAGGEVVLVMDSPAWAARARYTRERLGATSVRVKVSPGSAGG